MMKNHKKDTRRKFIKKLGGSALLLGAAPPLFSGTAGIQYPLSWEKRKFSANDRIRVGIVGMGIMGFSNAATATGIAGVELAGVCDLYDGRLTRSRELYGKDLFITKDYRKLLARQDIDAVIIATSDHWHDKISVAAMEEGKDVYCEKPMIHHWEEGKAVIDTQERTQKIYQVGSQRVSSIIYKKAKELYESGEIGQLVLAEAWFDRQSALGAWQYSIPTDASKKTVDWKSFLGDAPEVSFDPVRFFRWRNYQAYGTGVAGDLFVHLLSGLHLVTSSAGPTRIFATGGLRYWKDGRDVPDVLIGSYDYPETDKHPAFNLQMRVNFIDGSGGGSGINLVGTEGVLAIENNAVTLRRSQLQAAPGYGGWDSFHTFSEAQQKEFVQWYNREYPPQNPEIIPPGEIVFKAPRGYSDHHDHFANFFDSVRNGTPVTEDAVFGLRAAAPALAANMSYFQQNVIHWDPQNLALS